MMMPGFLLQGKAPDSKVPEKSRPRRPEKSQDGKEPARRQAHAR